MENVFLEVKIYKLAKAKEVWPIFAPHHYLSGIQMSARSFIAVWDDEIIGFTSSKPMPSGTLKNAWREHRTVVLPDYQGMGLGSRLAEWLGEWHLAQGHKFYSRTSHPKLGYIRESSPMWRGTVRNKKIRNENWSQSIGYDTTRVAFSHEYMGSKPAS